jgi:hypothetical protein
MLRLYLNKVHNYQETTELIHKHSIESRVVAYVLAL